ncbi:MAG: hypothetical protein JNJ97_02510, partial [Alphaproteobacteria bacterium]|nr:hypothetical protein [Alphaproteobacteria bacterium]
SFIAPTAAQDVCYGSREIIHEFNLADVAPLNKIIGMVDTNRQLFLVGAKAYYPEGTTNFAGVTCGIGSRASPANLLSFTSAQNASVGRIDVFGQTGAGAGLINVSAGAAESVVMSCAGSFAGTGRIVMTAQLVDYFRVT